MNVNVVKDKDFNIFPFERQLTKENSYINMLENDNSMMQSLQNLGVMDSQMILDSNQSYA